MQALHDGVDHPEVSARAELLGGLDYVYHVMVRGGQLGGGGLFGADVHPAVYLHGIGADDLCPEIVGQQDGRPRLAHSCGTYKHYHSIFRHGYYDTRGGVGMARRCMGGSE